MWLWVLIIGLIGLAIYLGFTVRDIWRSMKRLSKAAGEFGEAVHRFSRPSDRTFEPIADVYNDPARLDEARANRRRISKVRAEARRRRLREATGRWEDLTDDSFSSIGPEERERARQRVDEARS